MKMRSFLFFIILIAPFAGQGQWDQIGQTVFGDQQESYLGDEVSISDDGSTIAVGAPYYSTNGLTYNGKVQVFRLVNNVWTQLGTDLMGNENDETMGNSLCLNEDGTILAVGSEYGNSGNGKVSVFSYANDEWSLVGTVINGAFTNGKFGTDVSLSNDGQTLAVARFGFNGSYGSHIYEFDGSDWVNTAGGSSTDAVRSISISADGNRMIYAGQTWIHITDKVDGSWTTPTNISLVGDDGTNAGSSFLSMSGDGNVFAKGAELNDEGGTNAGVVVIIDRTDPDNWSFSYVNGSSFNRLGKAVSLNHDGTRFSVLGGTQKIYELIEGEWTLSYTIPEQGSSTSLSADGSIVAMGYVEYSTPEAEYAGLVKAFGGLPNESPSLTCPSDLTVVADLEMCSATVVLDDLIANDLEDGDILAFQTEGIASGEAFPVGTSSVTFTATDSGGLSTSCSYSITVVDAETPTVLCSPSTVYLNEFGTASISAEEVDAGSSDNCGIASFELDLTEFTCENLGENNVELTVTDESGNAEVCLTTILVVDTISPQIDCQNVDLYLDEVGFVGTSASDFVLSYSDNCEIEFLNQEYEFDCEDLGMNSITYQLFDESGNSTTCAVEVTVFDIEMPTIICQNTTLELDQNGETSLTTSDIDNGSQDNCSFELNLDIESFDCSDIGVNTVILEGVDPSGNTSTCTAEITVVDELSPDISCPENQIEFTTTGMIELPNYLDLEMVSALDNCADVVSITQDPLPGTELQDGDYEISFIAVDEYGNEAECSFDLTVEFISDIFESSMSTLEIYPNPASDVIFIKGGGNQMAKVEIYNLVGQKLISFVGAMNQPIDLSELASGEYVVYLLDGNSQETRKLIVLY